MAGHAGGAGFMCADAMNAGAQASPGMGRALSWGQTRPYPKTVPATDTHDAPRSSAGHWS